MFVVRKFPRLSQLYPVYAVIVFMVYTWTVYAFIRFLPYWLRFMNVAEILAVFSYAILVDFLESLGTVIFLLVLCVVLPARFLGMHLRRAAVLSQSASWEQ